MEFLFGSSSFAPFRVFRGPSSGAFSLVEVTLALGVVTFALLAIIGLIPVGLTAMKNSIDETVTSLILQDVRERLSTLPFDTAKAVPVYYYDSKGIFVNTQPPNLDPQAYFRVDVKLGPPSSPPPNSSLLVAVTKITWPVLSTGAASAGSTNQVKMSFLVTPLTTPQWKVLDPTFTPKMDL